MYAFPNALPDLEFAVMLMSGCCARAGALPTYGMTARMTTPAAGAGTSRSMARARPSTPARTTLPSTRCEAISSEFLDSFCPDTSADLRPLSADDPSEPRKTLITKKSCPGRFNNSLHFKLSADLLLWIFDSGYLTNCQSLLCISASPSGSLGDNRTFTADFMDGRSGGCSWGQAWEIASEELRTSPDVLRH